jgi:aryl-alcohol dehydrogenase-like predicted oxidoreductase
VATVQLAIANTAITCSRIAFGTASLHRVLGRGQRERLLRGAVDCGITHFDTAPLYGFGVAESALASLSRLDVTITTKVGLYPPSVGRAGFAETVGRKALGKFYPPASRPRASMEVALARKSLIASLRRLRRERVDLLLIHEPQFSQLCSEEWLRWLDAERDRVGTVGIAGEPACLMPFVSGTHPFAKVIQTRDSLCRQEAAPIRRAGAAPQITYGHFAASGGAAGASDLLRRTAERFPDTVLLVSTRRIDRIAGWARSLEGQ